LMFDTTDAEDFVSYDHLDFDKLFTRKTVLFVKTANSCPVLKFIVPLLYTQLFNIISKQIIK